MKNAIRIVIALLLVFGFASSFVLADSLEEDGMPAFSVDVSAVSGEDEAAVLAESMLTLIYNATYLPFAAPLILLLVGLTKRFTTINANILNLFFSVFIWAFWIAATEVGLGGQFESIIGGLATIGTAVLGTVLSSAGAGKLYDFSKSNDIAFFGFERNSQDTVLNAA